MSFRGSSDSVSVGSINLDALSVRSLEDINEALRQSVLALLASPEQMAALSEEDREQVQQLAADFWPEHVQTGERLAAEELLGQLQGAGSSTDSSEEEPEQPGAGMSNDENLVRTMQLLYGEMGSPMLKNMPHSLLFEIVRSIARLVRTGTEEMPENDEWSATIELLNCSSAGNLVQRLEVWPACHQRLVESVATSNYCNLFVDALHELSERYANEERRPATCVYTPGQCDVCCSVAETLLWSRGCCDTSMCVVCLHHWLMGRLTEIHKELACPGCATVLTVAEVRHLLSEEAVARREKLLDRHRDGNRERDCPRCSCMAPRPAKEKRRRLRPSKKIEKEQGGALVKCRQCDYLWCFECHSPTHPGLTCRQHRSGAAQLESWAKKTEDSGLRKAQRCPRCKVLIEKNEGCNHMTCGHCHHEFCYLCRKKWNVTEVRIPYFGWSVFGSHSSRLSVFGCNQTFLAEKPALRRFVRGILFVLRAYGLVVVPTVAVALLLPIALALIGIAIPLAPIIIPAVLIYMKLRK